MTTDEVTTPSTGRRHGRRFHILWGFGWAVLAIVSAAVAYALLVIGGR